MSGPDAEVLDAATAAVVTLLATRSTRLLVIGICGAQGSGKSTLANALAERLGENGQPAAILSIDDLYLTRQERARLAREVHPLLATRGPPGTHNVAMGCAVIDALRKGEPCRLPRFDKASDDRLPENEWPFAPADCAVLILEGWCVGASPQSAGELMVPVNALEADEDPQGIWRAYVNQALAGSYRQLFGQIDYLIFLQAPAFDVVLDWRLQQEDQLRVKSGGDGEHLMTRAQVARFIQHYERITRQLLIEMPGRADLLVLLDAERSPRRIVRGDGRVKG